MSIKFTKMHGLGNDFVVIDAINQSISLTPQQIAAMAERHTGIGFDQCLLIEPSVKENIDFNYRIFNADGQEVGQCGNGARCLALFAKHYGLTSKTLLKIATKTTQMDLYINPDNSVRVDMGIPKLNPASIPIQAKHQSNAYVLELDNNKVSFHAINVGNPHAVLIVQDIKQAPVSLLGEQLSKHPFFPEQANIGFMQIIHPQHIELRVYERGCGETLACGSGAVAAAAIGRLFYQLNNTIKVSLPGGELLIEWPSFKDSISLTGAASFVYEGTYF